MNVLVVTRSDGTPLWFSCAMSGLLHDLTAARDHGIVRACLNREHFVLADRVHQGAGATRSYRHREQP